MIQIISKSRNLLKCYKFSTYDKNSNYPYVFGGLKYKDNIFNNREQAIKESVVGELWGRSIFDQFVTAYNAYL